MYGLHNPRAGRSTLRAHLIKRSPPAAAAFTALTEIEVIDGYGHAGPPPLIGSPVSGSWPTATISKYEDATPPWRSTISRSCVQHGPDPT